MALCGCSTPTGIRAHAMRIESVKLDPRTASPVILLREEAGERRWLPIWIGVYEARSIAMGLEKIEAPRPNSHDLITELVQKLNGRVRRVLVTELRGGTYYAELELEVDGEIVTIDSRPSDAIAVAIRTGTRVYATDEVLRQAGIPEPEAEPEAAEALDVDWAPAERTAETLRSY